MVDTNLALEASSSSSSSSRISEKARIAVIGVRTSWLTWLRNSSFCRSTLRNCRLASSSFSAVARNWVEVLSNSWEYSMACWVSSAICMTSSSEIESPETTLDSMTWAEAAPIDPAISLSSRRMNDELGSRVVHGIRACLASSENSATARS